MDFYFFTDAALYFFGVEPACLAESNPRAASQQTIVPYTPKLKP